MHDRLQRPLSTVRAGSFVVLRRIRAGQELEARLLALGFVPGETVEVCRNAAHGPLVVSVKGSRVMLGRGMAERVAVE
ncbi:MAG: ferrous iron transport protein A [Opitutae bacterium]|nr:ferrous iron transport protein A [Opitutae bacterium]